MRAVTKGLTPSMQETAQRFFRRNSPNPPTQPHQSSDPLARVAEHARSVVAADGAEDWDQRMVLAMEEAIRRELQSQVGTMLVGGECFLALAALRVVREWEGRE